MVILRIRIPISRLKRYLKENLGISFIIACQILLAVCVLIFQMNPAMANEVAIYAFYSLVIGVVLQLVCLVIYGKENDGSNSGGTVDKI